MTFRSPGLLACFLSLLWTSSALAADPLATSSHFQITKSFPVSEATWAEKAVDLYLVAAQRSVLIYRKTGPGEANYQEVNRLFPGLDGAIENCAVAHGRLYVPASTLGLLAYRVADLEQPGAQPELRSASVKSVGAVSVAGGRVYARYRNRAEGGFGVFDAETLALLGEGLPGVPIFGLSAVTGNGLLNPQGVFLRDGVLGVPTTMEGVRFYSVTNPTVWSLLANVDLPSRHEGVAKHGRMVYVASGIGLATIDVSDPANSHEVHYWDFPYPGTPDINQGWVEGVDLADDILYAALGPAGFGTFRLTNPAQPVLLKKMLPAPVRGATTSASMPDASCWRSRARPASC